MGPGRAIFLLLRSGRVSHSWVWKISPKNPKFFNFFPTGQKKISSGWVKKYLVQNPVLVLIHTTLAVL